ncbi:hypothetical protein ACSAZL_03955 [Methanosarcina sp. T3]|uniref:hypothetical protein n=1 Tax=Methanosarcina sp. T3 TaxID=3439062 RepID=UPI003F83A7C3
MTDKTVFSILSRSYPGKVAALQPELRLGSTWSVSAKLRLYSPNCDSGVRGLFRQSCGSAVRCPFRCAQED